MANWRVGGTDSPVLRVSSWRVSSSFKSDKLSEEYPSVAGAWRTRCLLYTPVKVDVNGRAIDKLEKITVVIRVLALATIAIRLIRFNRWRSISFVIGCVSPSSCLGVAWTQSLRRHTSGGSCLSESVGIGSKEFGIPDWRCLLNAKPRSAKSSSSDLALRLTVFGLGRMTTGEGARRCNGGAPMTIRSYFQRKHRLVDSKYLQVFGFVAIAIAIHFLYAWSVTC